MWSAKDRVDATIADETIGPVIDGRLVEDPKDADASIQTSNNNKASFAHYVVLLQSLLSHFGHAEVRDHYLNGKLGPASESRLLRIEQMRCVLFPR